MRENEIHIHKGEKEKVEKKFGQRERGREKDIGTKETEGVESKGEIRKRKDSGVK